jgi:predicted RNA-binding Zn-ribbon protein involved in translation (DUF1610 family)
LRRNIKTPRTSVKCHPSNFYLKEKESEGPLKCPKCNEDMMVLCRRGSSGFFNELYYRCLACGFKPEDGNHMRSKKIASKKQQVLPRLKTRSYLWNAATAGVLILLVLTATMQIPIPVTVFAAQTSLDPVKDILPYIRLLNFTMTGFTLNYTEGHVVIHISANSATVRTTESSQNITTSTIDLQKVIVNYTDSKRQVKMGFTTLTITLTINYEALLAHIDAIAILPLWTTIINDLTGQLQ